MPGSSSRKGTLSHSRPVFLPPPVCLGRTPLHSHCPHHLFLASNHISQSARHSACPMQRTTCSSSRIGVSGKKKLPGPVCNSSSQLLETDHTKYSQQTVIDYRSSGPCKEQRISTQLKHLKSLPTWKEEDSFYRRLTSVS